MFTIKSHRGGSGFDRILSPPSLAILPLLFLYISLRYIQHAGLYFSTDVDPEFNYLFNGIALAHLKFHLNAIGHPGTPIQCLIAITARVVHLFRPGQPLWDDVMQYPWVYIRAAVITGGLINAVMLYYLGTQVARYTKSLIQSLFLQITPFAYLITIEASYRLMPELIMPAIICGWIILLVKRLHDNSPDPRKYSLSFALLFGFSLADKLTFLPFFLLPLFLLPGSKFKLRYSLLATVSFLLFAFPVLFNFRKFTGWVTGIISHKGVYGGGDKGFLDIQLFLWNLKTMVDNTRLVLILVGALTIITVIYLTRSKKPGTAKRMAIGVVILVVIQYTITAKHYALYYLTPALLLCIFIAFLIWFLFKNIFSKQSAFSDVVMIAFGLILLFFQLPKIKTGMDALQARQKIKTEAVQVFKPWMKKVSRIIVPDYYGCSAIEYALLFGVHESGRYGKQLTEKMKALYPGSVIFYPWDGYFYEGRDVVYPKDFLQSRKEFTVFVAGDSEKLLQQLSDSLRFDSAQTVNFKMLQHFPPTHEAVFSLTIKQQP